MDETPLDTIQICQEGKEKTSSNQGSHTKKWTPCWPVNYRQGKERHRLSNHLCEGSLREQDHRPVHREPQEVLALYQTLNKILELHRRARVRREEIHQGLTQSRNLNSFFCLVLTDEPPLDKTTWGTPTTNQIHILRGITITADNIRKRLVKLQANKASGPTQSAWMSSGTAHTLTSHYRYYSIDQYKQDKYPKSGETPTTEDRPRTDSPLAGIVIALAADGLRTRRLNIPSLIKNLHSFWILEWSIVKRVHDAWRMDNQLRSTASKKNQINFLFVINYWLLIP